MEIDIECSICGRYIFTIDIEHIVGPVSTICEICRTKEENEFGRTIYTQQNR